jgi:hypothetical protein
VSDEFLNAIWTLFGDFNAKVGCTILNGRIEWRQLNLTGSA